jgi:murein DD-endopeptidase MepM/ murein hydrolase activator NlpD
VKKTWTDRVGDFVAGKGFYIVLFLCVAAIGISGYYLFSTLGSSGSEVAADAPVSVVVTPEVTAQVTAPAVSSDPSPSPATSASPAPSASPSVSPAASPSPAAEQTAAEAPAASVFTWPVRGEVLSDFSLEVLAYDETMGDWRTHSGMDIAASLGAQVGAISSGTVEQVYDDDLMGTTVVIDHGDGLKSSYSNLASTPTVSPGDAVSPGSVIGSVGETALAEQTRKAHLHLELTPDGVAVDPANYLP